MTIKIRDNIKQVDITKLKEYKKNNKIHTEEQISLLVQIIDRFGFTTPLLIDKDKNIIAGHGRKLAAVKLGMKKLPCIEMDDLSEDEIKTLRIADNRIGEIAETSFINIQEEYLELKDNGSGIEFLTGYTEEDFDFLQEEDTEIQEDDFETPEDTDKIETDIKLGDIIQLGNHRLMCGSSTEVEDVENLTEQNKLNMCFTDPPYLMDFTGGMTGNDKEGYKQGYNAKHGAIKNDKMSKEDGEKFLDAVNTMIKDFVTGSFYITFYRLGIGGYFASLDRIGLQTRSLIIWEKGNHTLSNSDYMSRYEPMFYGWVKEHNFYGGNNGMDVWNISRTQKNDLHPTMKPIELCAKAIENSSKQGQTVLDLFGGSGSTLIACEQLNRKCYMMELDPKYCEVICQRWEKLTGKTREVL